MSDITVRGGSLPPGRRNQLLAERQRPPAEPWREWAIVGGCGFGKTHAHIEWIKANRPGLVCVFTHRMDDDWFVKQFWGVGIRSEVTSIRDFHSVRDMLAGVHPQHTVVLIDGAQSVHPIVLNESLAYVRARGLRLLINSTEAIW